MLLILQFLCAFLFGIGFLFTIIDRRTQFGPLFRNFSVCLLVFPVVAMLDLFSYSEQTSPAMKLLLQRSMHFLVLPFIPFSVFHILKIAGRPARRAALLFSIISAILAPIVLIDPFLRVQAGEVRGGPLYAWTFLPYGSAYILFAYCIMVGHLKSVRPGERKFPALHLLGYAFSTVGGTMDMLAVVNPGWYVFSSCKSIGIMIFGIFCIYFFVSHFFLVLSERNALFHKVEELNRRFEAIQPMRKMGESTAYISHEIKNYLSVVKSNNQLLRMKYERAGKNEEIDRIRRSTDSLESFIRSLLDFGNSADTFKVDKLALARVIEDCLELHFASARHKILFAFPPDLPDILGDRGRLERVFLNLVKNSLEANATRIRVHAAACGGLITLAVEDDGEGCEEAELKKIGTPFFTTKKSTGGSGLGMAITASIIHSHGGTMRIEPAGSERTGNRGVRVTLTFPVPVAPQFKEGKMS
ncbi:MAG TPA: HAMP domain-containing sensor histidine kinase [Fibrobacteria bacterium]|nr:HAMP domain-containing sensor histidine kinase [Fibrobacteria bacterium]